MKNTKHFLLILLIFYSQVLFAYNHSIELGYSYGKDPNHPEDNNSGFLLSGDFFPVWRSPMTLWSINGALGRWHSTASQHRNLSTAAVSLAFRFYPYTVANYPTYLVASAGPALLSERHFGQNTQARNITIQTNIGLGMQFNCLDVNLRLEHFSNAHTAKPNEGFNFPFLLSIGYLF